MNILHITDHIRPGGGPAGYLYNLNKALTFRDEKNVSVLAATSSLERKVNNATYDQIKRLVVRLPRIAREIAFYGIAFKRSVYHRAILEMMKPKIDKADCLIFHNQYLAYEYLKHCEKKFYIMPHSPVEFTRETAEIDRVIYNVNAESYYKRLAEKELAVYKKANGLIVPGDECLEGYFIDAPDKKELLAVKPRRYVISGVDPLVPSHSKIEMRQKLGIDVRDIVIGFFGRYVSHKGYDRFIEIANSCVDKRNMKFISAGIGSLRPSPTDNVQDFGWRSDVVDLIICCDVVLNLNRYTYFDLLSLECFSVGVPVLATAVGGNKILSKLVPDEVFRLFDFNADPIEHILTLAETNSSNLIKEVFNELFSLDSFGQAHVEMAKRL